MLDPGRDNYISEETSGFMKMTAMALVIAAHYSQWYITKADCGILITLMTKLGRYGVAIFFAVSGYGLVCSAMKRELGRDFLKRRAINVYIPYLVITLIIKLYTKSAWDVKHICSWLLGLDAWFVFVIMIFYMIFYLGYKYFDHQAAVITAGVALVSLLLAVIIQDEVWYSSNLSFAVGIYFKIYESKINRFLTRSCKWYFAVICIAFAASALIYTMTAGRIFGIHILFKVLASILWAALCMSIALLYVPGRTFRLPVYCGGGISLECYLIHMTVLNLFDRHADMPPLCTLAAALTATVAGAYIFHYLYKKCSFFSKKY